MGVNLRTLFARKEPTTDKVLRVVSPAAKKMDTVLYRDVHMRVFITRIPWHFAGSTPKRKQKFIAHNCAKYRLAWLPPLFLERSTA